MCDSKRFIKLLKISFTQFSNNLKRYVARISNPCSEGLISLFKFCKPAFSFLSFTFLVALQKSAVQNPSGGLNKKIKCKVLQKRIRQSVIGLPSILARL